MLPLALRNEHRNKFCEFLLQDFGEKKDKMIGMYWKEFVRVVLNLDTIL